MKSLNIVETRIRSSGLLWGIRRPDKESLEVFLGSKAKEEAAATGPNRVGPRNASNAILESEIPTCAGWEMTLSCGSLSERNFSR
jgi:hypothetical protein